LLRANEQRIVDFALQSGLPAMHEGSASVEAGGLMSYTADAVDQFRRLASYVDKILKGAKPAELPVQRPMTFELGLNLKTAQQIGLTVPPAVLLQADKVIK